MKDEIKFGETEYDEEEMLRGELCASYRRLFSGSADGEAVLKDLMEACLDGAEVCVPTKRDGSIDALLLAYNNGRQAIGAHIRNRMARGKE